MFSCPTCQKEFESGPKLGGHISSHNRKSRLNAKENKIVGASRNCRFCGQEFGSRSIGAHLVSCKLNPLYETYRKSRSDSAKKRTWSHEHREKMSEVVMKKVKEGTWHLSFSKSRTHEYKSVKFHGLWEVKFAMNLDDKNVEWRRPTEKFQYTFEGKTRNYTPDFWIPELDSYVEIKGYTTPKDEAKWSQFPLKLIILKGEDLIQLGILEDNEVKKLAK
jgi:hypothetical protein